MAPAQAAPPPGQPPALKQMALTDKQIQGVLAAQKDMDAITEKLPDNAQPDPKVTAQLEAVAKKNGFASYDEYNDVIDKSAWCSAASIPRPRNMSAPKPSSRRRSPRSRPTRRCRPRTRRKRSTISIRR